MVGYRGWSCAACPCLASVAVCRLSAPPLLALPLFSIATPLNMRLRRQRVLPVPLPVAISSANPLIAAPSHVDGPAATSVYAQTNSFESQLPVQSAIPSPLTPKQLTRFSCPLSTPTLSPFIVSQTLQL